MNDEESAWRVEARRIRGPEPRPDEEARRRLREIFSDDVTDADHALAMLQIIIDEWLGEETPWSVLEGKKVLDLASGSEHGNFYPWLSRLCAVFGADVTAVDLLPQGDTDTSKFTSVQADVIETVLGSGLGSIPALSGNTFDLIISSRFVGFNPERGVVRKITHRGISMSNFKDMLQDQATQLLAPGGYIDVTDSWMANE